MTVDRQVVVVGAGIGGLTAALCLARAGARVTVLEQVPQPREVGAGILLMSNGVSVLAGLGLADVLEQCGRRIEGGVLHDAKGRVITRIAMPDHGPGLDHGLMLRRSALHRVLLDAAGAHPGIRVRLGVRTMAARPAGEVDVEGPDGPETLDAELVVGADGVRSTVRDHGDFDARVRDLGALSVRGMVPAETTTLDGLHEYWSPAGVFGGAPLGDGTTYFFTSATRPPLPQVLAVRDLARFRAVWRDALPASGPVLDLVEHFDQLHVTAITRVSCRRWVDGRLVLLGDAAHAMPPNLGQGGSSAILDAAVLAVELAAAGAPATGLRRYERRRRPAATAATARACRLLELTENPPPAAGPVRNALVRATAAWLPTPPGVGMLQEDPAALRAGTVALAG